MLADPANQAAAQHAQSVAVSEMGKTAWLTIALGLGIIAGYASVLISLGLGHLSLPWAFGLTAILAYASYTIVHEAVHGSITGQRRELTWLNELLGLAAAQVLWASFTAHRKEHLAHHRHTNTHNLDPDLKFASGGILKILMGAVRGGAYQLEYYVANNWVQASNRDRFFVVAETVVAISWRIMFVMWVGWETGLTILIGAAAVGNLITVTLFAWIVHRPHNAVGRFKDTATFVFPPAIDRAVSWLWLFQNYHSIHHLYPKIPFYRYRDVFRQIEDHMRANGSPIIEVGMRDPLKTSHA